MNKLSLKIPGFGLILLMAMACQTPPEEARPPEPSIRILDISPTNVEEFKEVIVLTLEYLDYDGDIGSPDPDEKTLSVLDSRLSTPDFYHVPPIAPVGQEVPIRGSLVIPLQSLFLLGNGTEEQVFFTVKIRDRAGNWSTEDISPTVTVFRP